MKEPGEPWLVRLPRHIRADGEVVVAEAVAHVPFEIQRMFTLTASPGAKRGHHAHRLCSQFMICVSGAVDVVCDDGRKEKCFELDQRDVALVVPPGVWNTVAFRQNDSVVVVLCDRVYEAQDYIRDYAEFLSFRGAVEA